MNTKYKCLFGRYIIGGEHKKGHGNGYKQIRVLDNRDGC